MARVTVEDCIDKIPNRFELVMSASQRARAIGSGAALMVDRDRDKNTVVSLREIAEEKIAFGDLQESLVRNYQRSFDSDDTDDSVVEHMHGELEWSQIGADAAGSDFAAREDEDGEDDEDDSDDASAEGSLEGLAGGSDEDEE